jgi:two-component system chemotaxis response regulator CheB
MVRSAVTAFGGDLLAVVLTGMGSDGRGGCEQVLAAGGRVIVQDEATSVVWGMPGAVATGPGAHAVLPLDDVADAVRRVVAGQGVGKVAARTGGAA